VDGAALPDRSGAVGGRARRMAWCTLALGVLAGAGPDLGLDAASTAVASSARPRSPAALLAAPAQATPGSVAWLTGWGFPPRARGTILLGAKRLGDFTVERRGQWAIRVCVPRHARVGRSRLRVEAGARVIEVVYPVTRSETAGASDTSIAALSTGESVRLSATHVTAGSSESVKARGFRRRALISVRLDTRRIATWRANARGTLQALLPVPDGTRPGPHTLSVYSKRHRLRLRLVVTQMGSGPGNGPGGGSPGPGPSQPDPVVDAVGDMGCAFNDPNYNGGDGIPSVVPPADDCLQRYVSDLVVNPLPTALLDLGDNQYNTGALFDYQNVFGPTFGRANAVTYPSLGNAEYNNGSSPPSGFFSYFNTAGVFSRIQAGGGGDTSHLMSGGYYSFNLGTWHIIALNSNCYTGGVAGGCTAGSPEEAWLKNDLAATSQKCILAYWHHPLYSALANDTRTRPFWTDLYNAHATLVLNGHGDHHYERFAPQDPSGNANPNGVREFIVSTGGQSHGVVPSTTPANSEIANYNTFGILRLTLHPNGYDWQFVPATADGQPGNFADSGSGSCN
jgi:acid phosphatase type 7